MRQKNLSQQNFDMGKCMIMPDYQGINLIVMFYPGTVYQQETYYVIVSKCLVFWQGGSWELRVELTVSSPRCRRLFQGIALTRLCPTCVVHLSYHILTIQKGLFYWILFVSNIWTQGSVQRLIFKKKVPDDKRPHLNRPFLWNYTWKPIGKILT